ncbi:hypothetical protein SAMN05216376_11235 [Mameliella alba]|nr:hypothetical protein [Mameliella alba]OWV46150.1 hypothetical protein CDZ96_19910 [Mameliella alba]PTR37004.1 hypothetical protein LX94_03796 [Mameliella alba]GGF77008.1 hypothetical protein GCM10011319_41690 [Mameliella alba]SDD81796.1 hypothetical protein SAMN05216376_11235 [Mameliella alba]
MKLAALLYCTDLDRHRFNTLRRREQLPIIKGSADDADSRQSNYSLDDAFRLRLFLDLIGQGETENASITPTDACNIVVNVMMMERSKGQPHPLDMLVKEELWAGVVVFEEGHFLDQGEILRFSQWYGGALPDVHKKVGQVISHTGRSTRAVRVVLANATRAANFVRQKAVALGISEAYDLYEEWPD